MVDGYQFVIQHFAASHPGLPELDVRLETAVRRIEHDAKGVTIHLEGSEDGEAEAIHADFVIQLPGPGPKGVLVAVACSFQRAVAH